MKTLKERLPRGFTRRASGSLRVQVRVGGYQEIRNFPLMADTTLDRQRQKIEAEAWATETRRRIANGSHFSARDAERTPLSSALERYAREGLKGDVVNAQKDRHRINILLRDPISAKMLAQLRKTDVVALRDRLHEAGFLRRAETLANRIEKTGGQTAKARVAEIRSIKELVRQGKHAAGEERTKIELSIAAIAARENIKEPARTTVSNVIQLVSRALKYAGQTMEGIPDITGVQMPPSSPGRVRRVNDEEISRLLGQAEPDHLMRLIIRFAVATCLRRERLLSCRTSHMKPIGVGRMAISFPRASAKRKKRTGIIPVTREISDIIHEALKLQGFDDLESAPDVPFFPIKMQAFESRWKRLLAAAAVKDLHFHDFRHEGTSRLFERGLTTAEVMSVTGHSTTEMVERYSHYSSALVLDKLELGEDAPALLAQVGFLIEQFIAAGGDTSELNRLLQVASKRGGLNSSGSDARQLGSTTTHH